METKHWLRVAAVLLSLAGATPAQSADAVAGKAVYSKSCTSCHGANGEGKEAVAKVLKAELRHLGSAEVQAKSDEVLRKEIVEGVGKMKPVKGLSDADLQNVIAFVRTLKQ